MPDAPAKTFQANGRTYHLPGRPVVVICLDGSSDEYLDAALEHGRMPRLRELISGGYRGAARAALPTFTNVNNASIITGVPPSIHGITGNYFYDTEAAEERMMNAATFLRAETIPGAAARAGRKVAVITAKDKLRDIFAHQLKGIAFSAEKAGKARLATHGIENVESIVGESTPEIYSGEASLFVLRAGVALLEKKLADFFYLSTTDYIQHLFAPEEQAALDFYGGLDESIGRLQKLGATIGITADHGMNAKQMANGQPNVIYLETELEKNFGPHFRVILPITDPYVVHHGALGSCAMVHLGTPEILEKVHDWLRTRPGITEVHDRAAAVAQLDLPGDRIGDLVVFSGRDVVLGRRPEQHDLSALRGGLRSHGGRFEEQVPLILSEPLSDPYRLRAKADCRNFDIFDFVLNGARTGS